MQARKWGNAYRTTVVCIDSYDQRVPAGRFYNLQCPEGVRFHGVMELLTQLEQMLDQMRFPENFTMVRTFGTGPEAEMDRAEEENREGAVATLALRVLFRQNASWQGSVTWLEGHREESFRSVLELLFLLDSAAGIKL